MGPLHPLTWPPLQGRTLIVSLCLAFLAFSDGTGEEAEAWGLREGCRSVCRAFELGIVIAIIVCRI